MSTVPSELCYACDQIATSREHAPSRCLFPPLKDCGGVDSRRDLITVWACDAHNQSKSADDEYLWYTLAMNVASGAFGREVFLKRVMRAIERKPALAQRMFADFVPLILVHEETGQAQGSVGVIADWRRLEASFALIARAIYYHHFGERNLLPAKVICEFQLQIDGPAPRAANELMRDMVLGLDQLFGGREMHGANQRVFQYQVFAEQDLHRTAIRLHFYEGARVTVLLDALPAAE
jgi:hypothetical protein